MGTSDPSTMSSVSANLNVLRRFVTVKPRVPLIKFRKGGPSTAGDSTSAAAASPQPAAAAPAGPAVYEWWEMPSKYRRQLMDLQECDVINMGETACCGDNVGTF